MVAEALVDYVRKGLEKKYSALVIRGALKKSGYNDKDISAAFAAVRKEKPVDLPKVQAKPVFKEISDIPLPPIAEIQEPKHHKVRHIIVAALFLLALVLLMFAVFAPLLTNIG